MSLTSRIQGQSGALAIKVPVLVATTSAITLSSTQTIDGVAVSSSQRVLVKDQSDATENGIYVADTGTWSRAKDFNGSLDVVYGTLVYVNEGTAGGSRFFEVSSTGNNVPGTNEITFAEAPFAGSLGTVLDTNGQAINFSEGSSIVASSEINIWQTDGNTIHVADGSTSIETMSTAPRIGANRWVIFQTTATLVHSTTSLILPSSANIKVLPGDAAFMYADSTLLTRMLNFLPRDHRHYSVLQSVSSSGAAIRNSGITLISSVTATALTFTLGFPRAGSMKEIVSDTTSSAIAISNTATSILFRSSGGGGSTIYNMITAPPNRGSVMTLRGLSTNIWQVTYKSGGVSS